MGLKIITNHHNNQTEMGKEKKFITCDGNYAAAHIAYMFSEVRYLPHHPIVHHGRVC